MVKPAAFLSTPLLMLGLLAAPMGQARAGAEPCPQSLRSATRLLVVVSRDMDVIEATAQMFERPSSKAAWSKSRPAMPVALGRRGLGWAWDHRHLGVDGEPTKQEGDRRTPAGIFPIGSAFGFAATGPGKGYLPLKQRELFCVNDARSSRYNEIIPKTEAGSGVSGESMSHISVYRRGLLVGLATNRKQKGGSCIFIHVWRRQSHPTLGCLAFSESNVAKLQDWAAEAPALVAILPRRALDRLQGCLPRL